MTEIIKEFVKIKSLVKKLSLTWFVFSEWNQTTSKHIDDALEFVECRLKALWQQICIIPTADSTFDFMVSWKSLEAVAVLWTKGLAITQIHHWQAYSCTNKILWCMNSPTFTIHRRISYRYWQKITIQARRLSLRRVGYLPRKQVMSRMENHQTQRETSRIKLLLSWHQHKRKQQRERTTDNVVASLKRSKAVFESSGKRPSSLESIYKALLTVPPSSIGAETSFSAFRLSVWKVRRNLEDSAKEKINQDKCLSGKASSPLFSQALISRYGSAQVSRGTTYWSNCGICSSGVISKTLFFNVKPLVDHERTKTGFYSFLINIPEKTRRGKRVSYACTYIHTYSDVTLPPGYTEHVLLTNALMG